MQRPLAGNTVNGDETSDAATTSGRSTSASSDASVAAAMATCNVLWKSGVKPQRFIDTRASGESSDGSFPSAEANVPSGRAVTRRRSSTPSNWPVGAHFADTAGDRGLPDHGVGQAEADQGIGGVEGHEMRGQECAGGPPVDVVGVSHTVGRVADVVRSAQNGVDRAERSVLEGEADVDVRGPGVLDVVADRRTVAGPSTSTIVPKPAARASLATRSMTASPRGPDWRQRFDASVAAGSTGRQDDEGRAGRRCGAHGPQRRTALAHVMPPPKPVRRRLSPSWTRSLLIASCRASGMEADEVLP